MSSIDRYGDRWRARWRDPDGASKSKVFKKQEDAKKHLVAIEHSKLTGSYIDPDAGRITFYKYAENWRSIQAHHRPSTSADIERQLRLHVYPTIGQRPIGAIMPSEIQALVTALSKNLAASSLETTYTWMKAVFNAAVRDRLRANSPCEGVKLPRKAPSSTLQVLTTGEVMAMADTINPRYRALVIMGAGTGLRPSELLGVTIDRVDFLRRTVRVDRQLARAGKQLVPPKSDSSYRTVPLPETVTADLAEHLTRWPSDDFLFTSRHGKAVSKTALGEAWREARDETGAPEWATPHDLRHYYASLLIARGSSVKVVQARLGHETAVTTLDTYGHLWPDDEDATRTAVDLEFGWRVTSVS